MIPERLNSKLNNTLAKFCLHWLAGSPIPASWLYPPVLPESKRLSKRGLLNIEIVSHCWQYSRLLSYQLGSLIQHPVNNACVTMTVFFSEQDKPTRALLDMAAQTSAKNIIWNWRPLSGEQLFRRSIGRNLAAIETTADWIWFTDCDMTFQNNCIDSLANALQGKQDALVYPRIERRTEIHAATDLIDSNTLDVPEILHASPDVFTSNTVSRATGPLQITHGDVARVNGYCKDINCYQQPASSFQKATEDRVFRWLLGTQGTPLDIEGVCRIQHIEKGRYKENSNSTRWRKAVRRLQYAWRERTKKQIDSD